MASKKKVKYKKYKYDDWDGKFNFADVDFSFDKQVYVDKLGSPITGLLENYWFFAFQDPKNWQLVINGKKKGPPGIP